MALITERPADHALAILRKRVGLHLNPFFGGALEEESLAAIDRMSAPASDEWVSGFVELSDRWAERAANAGGAEAEEAWAHAYDYAHIARYPVVDTDASRRAYELSVGRYRQAGAYRADISHIGIESSAGTIRGILRVPASVDPAPLLICVGGLDVWKEELIGIVLGPYVAAGFAVLALDGPGTGESPFAMAPAADAMWDPVLDWADAQGAFSPFRSVLGTSFGGYWAARVAHTHADRLDAVIDHGGPAHYTFTDEWFDHWVDRGEYPTSFARAVASVTRSDATTLTQRLADLSLLGGGLLEGPCAPMLLVNGLFDKTCNPADMELLLRVGQPKTARFFAGGHMGFTPQTAPTMVSWLSERVRLHAGSERVRAHA